MFPSASSIGNLEEPPFTHISDPISEYVRGNICSSEEDSLFPEDDFDLNETLSLMEENMRLSQQIFGDTESIVSFSQGSRQSLTEILGMIDDVNPINNDKNYNFNKALSGLNRRLSEDQQYCNKSVGGVKKAPKTPKLTKSKSIYGNYREKCLETKKTESKQKRRLSQDQFPEEDFDLNETLSLMEENMQLSQQIFGDTESIVSFSQGSRQSLTEILGMIDDVNPINNDKHYNFNKTLRGLNPRLNEEQQYCNNSVGIKKAPKTPKLKKSKSIQGYDREKCFEIKKTESKQKRRLSQDQFPEEDFDLNETLLLVEKNIRLSQQMVGDSESITSFSQNSRQSLTEFLSMIDDLNPININKNSNLNKAFKELNRKLSEGQESSYKGQDPIKKTKKTPKIIKSKSKDSVQVNDREKGHDIKKSGSKRDKAEKKSCTYKSISIKINHIKKTKTSTIEEMEVVNGIRKTRSQTSRNQKNNNTQQFSQQPCPKTGCRAKIDQWRVNKLKSLQQLRDVGLYVLCDSCDKTRYLPDVKDPLDLPENWYCYMNPDPNYNSCSSPDYYINPQEEAKIIINKYHAGSIVWAKNGSQWWPALIDDNPDTLQYFWMADKRSKIPTWYHVTFFGSSKIRNTWKKTEELEPFRSMLQTIEPKKCRPALKAAIRDAKSAGELSILDRLQKFSYLQRYILKEPKKGNKRNLDENKEADGNLPVTKRRSPRLTNQSMK
ncbi:uncharacterized protein LOC126742059 [Anthonomus grandis grandis]|uniref:uncharacterized protein LOC126742059 n=1 Tax=Anthonomus grandis grandis TaxID=2921223 RepID=UPI002166080B|nr:uncharacterized protein LOC126742059 [Anthonomus grandis grandis]XP_050304546.1 uncharacterized protein LOC126742059 [Anthonomus grandis grandis]